MVSTHWKTLLGEKQAQGDVIAVVILPQDPPSYAAGVKVIGQPPATIEVCDEQYALFYQASDTFLRADGMSAEQIAGLLKIHDIPAEGWEAL